MNISEKKKVLRSLFRDCLRPLAWLLFNVIYPYRVFNREVILDAHAPYLLVANHNSNLDAVLLAWMCPYDFYSLGKRELVRGRFSRWLLEEKLHMIPISRNGTDVKAMRDCMKVLKAGNVLCVFPEGTRHMKALMEKVEKGVALLAMRQNVDMLPVYIDGKPRLFRRNRAIVGTPLRAGDYPPGPYSDDKADQLCASLRSAFHALRDRLSSLK